jgi:molybdenum cofactor cytidylyltransferase
MPTTESADSPRIGAIVLAAGAGARMGHRPKCLMQFKGQSLLERLLHALLEAKVSSLTVVLGHHAERIQQDTAWARWDAHVVVNPDPDAGHVSSLRAGLSTLPSGLDAVIVALADQPLIDTPALQALLTAYRQRPTGTQLLQPSVQGLPGNPVVFSAEVMTQILAEGVQMGVRQWQQAHPERAYRWETPDACFRQDVDNEADRQAFEALTGHRLCWPDDLSRPMTGDPST